MNNWMKYGTEADIKEMTEKILSQVMIEKQEKIRSEIVTRFFELLEISTSKAIDAYGLGVHVLKETAETIDENPEVYHTIYYDATTKKEYVCANTVKEFEMGLAYCPQTALAYVGSAVDKNWRPKKLQIKS